jgi:nitrite reductase (NO-forming)
VSVNLTASEVITELAPDKKAWVWTFNGTVPGPMIRVKEGDTVEINLTNAMESIEPHNIDFHAAMGPGGGASVTNVEPGETATLRFKALKPGAFIYHCAGEGMAWEHISYGMYGLIMVEPKYGLRRVDKEYYVAQQDWYHDALSGGAHGLPDDVYILDDVKASDELPSLYTFNGHQQALLDPLLYGDAMHTNQGDKVRFFFVNGGPNKSSSWHIIGTIFDQVYRSDPRDAVHAEETVLVPPGSAAVFELTTPVPGQYLLVDHALWRAPKGAAGILNVDQTGAWPDNIFWPQP